MTIAFRHGEIITEIGIDVVLHSLLSTVAVRLAGTAADRARPGCAGAGPGRLGLQ